MKKGSNLILKNAWVDVLLKKAMFSFNVSQIPYKTAVIFLESLL